jgi:hypothetical protein
VELTAWLDRGSPPAGLPLGLIITHKSKEGLGSLG